MVKKIKPNLDGLNKTLRSNLENFLKLSPIDCNYDCYPTPEPDCPMVCKHKGKKWECYTEYYKKCEHYNPQEKTD